MSTDFLTLGIRKEITAHLKEIGITEPTPIQTQAIPVLMAGKDLVAQSQTGTGKTLAFLLPILERIKVEKQHVQALIITPTRELALQITKEAQKIADVLGANVISVHGGYELQRQTGKLRGNPHIIIGTPGRLLDHIRRGNLSLAGVSKLVLDEADQMLHMGFLDDVEEIIRQTGGNRQTILFSATIPSKIRNLADRYMQRPIDIRLQVHNVTLDEIKQLVIETTPEKKLEALCAVIDQEQPYLAMIFCHTKQRAIDLGLELAHRGYEVDEFHGDLSQAKRAQVMRRFREARLQLLVVTDIAARGLDIEGITHVFNYDISRDVESYIHRIGRTGRAGQTGTAITFIVPGEQTYLRMIEQGIRASIKKIKAGQDIATPKSADLQDRKTKTAEASAAIPKKRVTKRVKSHSGTNQRSSRKAKSGEGSSANKPRRGKGKGQRSR